MEPIAKALKRAYNIPGKGSERLAQYIEEYVNYGQDRSISEAIAALNMAVSLESITESAFDEIAAFLVSLSRLGMCDKLTKAVFLREWLARKGAA